MRYLALKVSLAACGASWALGTPALAQPADARTRACIEDNRVAQEEMLAGHYESAKKHALACAVDSCAKVLRDDCRQLADNANQKLEKSSDTKPGPAESSAPVAVPPGGESPATHSGSEATAGPAPADEKRDVVEPRSRVPSYVLFGVAAAAAGSFGFFALSGRSKENNLTCDDHCSDSELDPITRNYLIADVSLGISLAALAGGLILWPWGSEQSATALRVSPREVRLRVSF